LAAPVFVQQTVVPGAIVFDPCWKEKSTMLIVVSPAMHVPAARASGTRAAPGIRGVSASSARTIVLRIYPPIRDKAGAGFKGTSGAVRNVSA
jgi:hypothetical protein